MSDELKERLFSVLRWLGVVMLLALFGGLVYWIFYASLNAETFPDWTGFNTRGVPDDTYPARTLWDWLSLLLVPVVLAVGGLLFTWSENRQTRAIERERVTENQRIERERVQDAVLESYLDQMTDLLLNQNYALRDSAENDEVRSVARARTLTALRGIDGARKATVVQFLYEAQLIGYSDGADAVATVVQLHKSDISGASLEWANLTGASLEWANLTGAKLGGADLTGAKLLGADLTWAKLEWANLTRAVLTRAKLGGAVLTRAKLGGADLTGASLEWANLTGADLTGAKLLGADLTWAVLTRAKLGGADLTWAVLREADLTRADLTGADLTRADLTRAKLGGVNLGGAVLEGAKLGGTDLTGADLTRAVLTGARLEWANLSGADLTRAVLEGAKLGGADLSGADLAWANLSGASLEGADLSYCQYLTLEQLLQAKSLHGAILPDYINPADLGDLWSPPKPKNTPKPMP